jgi:basic amino acid/polyamine antiporter, APA family
MPASPQAPTLARRVSRWQIVGLALNDVIGSGIYLLPAAAAALLGPASLWAVALAGLTVLLLVLCFAEAAGRFDGTGGVYLYARTAFGELVGFEVGWMAWLTRVAVASLSVGFSQALSHLWPAAAEGTGRFLAVTVPVLALTAVNLVGVRSGVRTAMFLVISKVVPLLIFVGAGVFAFSSDVFFSQEATNPGRLGQAALLLLFAFAGFENTPAPAGEYKRPQRDLPFALLVHVALVTGLYLSVQAVALGTLPGAAGSDTPLADAAQGFLGPAAGVLLTVGAALSILGTNSNSILSGPRYLYALAADGYGPRLLAGVHPRWRTPAAAILVQTAVVLPLAWSGSFAGLAALSVVARLTTYVATAAAVPVLRRKLGPSSGFRLPGGPAIPALAIAVTLGLAASATARNLIVAGIALLVGLGIYGFYSQRSSTGSPRD